MKQVFPSITGGDVTKVMDELTVGQIIGIAKMDQKRLEQQLSAFLVHAMQDSQLPYTMTGQQRYYFLLQYLAAQRNNDLSPDVNVNDYLIAEDKPWQLQTQVDEISVRQLNGTELEALELIATGLDEWIMGAMALQISFGDEFPYMQPITNRRHAGNVIKSRFEQLSALSQDRFNELYAKYEKAEEQLSSLLHIGFDGSDVVIFKADGGSDSEPARFQCDSAFYGFAKQIFTAMAEGSAEVTAEREPEPS